jgi:hypothetical protein
MAHRYDSVAQPIKKTIEAAGRSPDCEAAASNLDMEREATRRQAVSKAKERYGTTEYCCN